MDNRRADKVLIKAERNKCRKPGAGQGKRFDYYIEEPNAAIEQYENGRQ